MPMPEWISTVRTMIGTDWLVTIGATGIVVNDKKEILLQQRADNSLWSLPGGAIDPGEEPAQAAIHAVYEETGLHVEAMKLIGIFGGEQQRTIHPDGRQTVYMSITFECRVVGGTLNPDSDETKDVRWFDIHDLPEPFVPVHVRQVESYLRDEVPYFVLPDTFRPAKSNYIVDIRKKIDNMLIMMPGCDVLIFNDEGHLLVQKRGDDGQWNLPGGMYEPGEEPAETAMREVYEEIGLLVRPIRLVGVYGGEQFIHTYPNGDTVAFIDIVFVAEILSGEHKADKEETLDLCFVPLDDLPKPFFAVHRMLIEHALTRNTPYFAI